jgi:hypothetical protein
MKIETVYRANDGRKFKTEEECIKYESHIKEVNIIMATLNPIPSGCDFLNGEGYIQQKPAAVKKAINDLFKLGCFVTGVKAKDWSHYSIGRVYDDGNYKALYRAWGRLNNIDKYSREWGQGYYAINPDKGQQFDLTIYP